MIPPTPAPHRPLRILYHHRTLGDGAEGIHIREMVDALRRLGHEVRLVGPAGESNTQAARQRSRWSRVAAVLPDAAYEVAEIAYNGVARATLGREVRHFNPDIIYDRYNTYSTAAVSIGRAHGIPALIEVNTIAFERQTYEHHRLRMPSLANRYERSICAAASHVFAVSTPLARFLETKRGVETARLTVLPNGANPRTFNPDASRRLPEIAAAAASRIVIGLVGILRPWHGVDMFLQACMELMNRGRDVHVLIVGDGPMEPELRRLVAQARIADRVTFTGRVAHQAVKDCIASMDIAVSARATFYASPMKIVEYMAMGRAVVAPAMENIRDLIDDGRNGLLFEPERTDDLARRLEELIVAPARRIELGHAARRKVEEVLNWDRNARIVETIGRKLATEILQKKV